MIDALPLLLADDGYQISRSVRLRSSANAYFSRTFAASSGTTDTISFWVKRGQLGAAQSVLDTSNGVTTSFGIFFNASDSLEFYDYSSAFRLRLVTTQVFRDPSAWYHIVCHINTTNATAANRAKVYVNGSEVTAFSTATYPAQNTSLNIGGTQAWGIGVIGNIGGQNLDGYLTEFNLIDGQALTPSSFGETDSITGVWKPKKYTGTYGTNGFYLNFSDNSLNTDVTSTATATAPFGGTADNAKISDSVYLTTNTSTGSAFDVVKYDFGASVQMTRFVVGAFSFSGGSSTFQIQVSNDDSTYTTVSSLSVTSTGTNYSGSINAYARYVKLRATAFGTNGQATLDVFQILQDGIGKDSSGNGNNWTPNNISVTAGATYDSMLDVPTPWADGGNGRGNYAVWNRLLGGSTASIEDGNLFAVHYNGATAGVSVPATIGVSTGKWYFEYRCFKSGTNVNAFGCGVTNDPSSSSSATGQLIYADNGQKISGGTATTYGATYGLNDIIGVALDLDAGNLTFYKNNVSQGVAYTGLSGTYWPHARLVRESAFTSGFNINCGQQPFAYTPPSGFKALNTLNLPEPTIKKGASYFDATTYLGNGGTQTVSNLSFQPDLVWIKNRSAAANHALLDSVRPSGFALYPNLTDAEANNSSLFTGISGNSFSLAGGNVTYNAANNYISWYWKEGATQGFDIVTYTGNGTNPGRTVAHNLGVAPAMIITKSRSGTGEWPSYHKSLPISNTLYLNATYASSTYLNRFSAVSSTDFTTGTNGSELNTNGVTYVAYLFAEVAGFSRFGSYTGNGSTDGPFVFCGFRPRWVMMKRTDTGGFSWIIQDTARDVDNPNDLPLYPDLSNAEAASNFIDILSNGFKLRNLGGGWNASGGTYIFTAFAENPFKNALAR